MTCVAVAWDEIEISEPGPKGEAPAADFADERAPQARARAFVFPRRRSSRESASEADLLLESPNSLGDELAALRARGSRRVNDPRRR